MLLRQRPVQLALALLILCAVALRIWFISNNNVLFWFDQARDATVVQEIVQDRNLTLQGPSASGTNDTVYHGVLYYYVIAPFYAMFQGNPVPVAGVLGVVNALTIIPLFLLTYHFTRSVKYSFLASFLFAFSYEQVQLGTWLSNPTLAIPTIFLFYFFLWRVFWQNKTRELVLVALFLGLSNQAIIFSAYLGASVLIALGRQWWGEKRWQFSLWQIVLAAGVYLVSVASMLLNQFRLWRSGIFRLETLSESSSQQPLGFDSLLPLLQNYFGKFENAFFPNLPLLAAGLAICLLAIFFLRRGETQQKIFFGLWILAPIFLLALQFRSSYHTLIGLTPAFYLIVVLALQRIKVPQKKWLEYVFFTLFVIWSIAQLAQAKEVGYHVAQTHNGSDLRTKLEVIDYTYNSAQGLPFSISTLTLPYGYNTTWAYLYDWYGAQLGEVPVWYGPTQTGIFAGDKLQEVSAPNDLHFSIAEYQEFAPGHFQIEFADRQSVAGEVQETQQFGEFTVQKR